MHCKQHHLAQEVTQFTNHSYRDLAEARAKAGKVKTNQWTGKDSPKKVWIPVFLAESLEMDPRKSVKVSWISTCSLSCRPLRSCRPQHTSSNSAKGKTSYNTTNTELWHSMLCFVMSTAQHSTAQHSTAQHSTAQHSTAQHSAM